MTGKETSGLMALVGEQIELYRRLESLSERQHELVLGEDTDALLGVLGERQTLIESISEVSAQMAPYRARWDEHVGTMSEAGRASLRRGLDELASMMSRIAERDEDDRRVMEDRRSKIQNQIAGVKRGGAAVRGYAQQSARGPRFQDREA